MLADRMRKPTTPLDKLIIIEQLVGELDECIAQLDGFDHVPERELFPQGRPITTSDPCAKSCPACALQRKFMCLKLRLGPIHQAVLGEVAQHEYNYKERERQRNRESARKKRRKRGQSPQSELRFRGLRCVLGEYCDITAERLCELLEVEPLTYDDDDIELYFDGDVVVRDLDSCATIKTVTIKKASLRTYLSNVKRAQ